ncbi:MAG: ankyrin repeat domain-containing protein [Vulcanimicrobiota bacterium]
MKYREESDTEFIDISLNFPKMSVLFYVELLRMEKIFYRRRIRDFNRFLSILRKELTEHPALLHEAQSRNVSQLHWAVKYKCPEVVDFLLTQGAQVNCATRNGVTPLHWASEGSSRKMISLLLQYGASINFRDKDGKTPLHWAVRAGRKRIARFLIDNGADVYAEDNSSNTPLHLAAEKDASDFHTLFKQRRTDCLPDKTMNSSCEATARSRFSEPSGKRDWQPRTGLERPLF